jgi:hypothetical protein
MQLTLLKLYLPTVQAHPLMIKLTLVLLAFASFACNRDKCAKGEGDSFERRFNLPNFKHFIVDIPGDIDIYPDTMRNNSQLVVLGQKNVLDRIDVNHSGGVVRMSFSECLTNHSNIKFRLYVHSLERISVQSAARIKTQSNIYTPSLHFEGKASTESELAVYTPYLKTQMLNAGQLSITGYARRHESQTAAGTSVFCRQMLCDTAHINHASFGQFELYVFGFLKADISGGTLSMWGSDTLQADTLITPPGVFHDMR